MEIDERLGIVAELKREYVALVDDIFHRHQEYTDKVKRLDKLKEVLETIGQDSVVSYADELRRLIDRFEEDERLEDFKADMNDQLAKFQNLKSIICMDDVGEKYMCFTCLERSVEVFLDPCGHVSCTQCQPRFGTTCPFCRVPVTPKRMFLG
jgi:DNA repair ATPase RecN